ncbi:MAG: hypothetical protein HEQ35_09760 [Gloeotrichia echinulata IR180]
MTLESSGFIRGECQKIPNVEFRFYGRPSDENYFAQCQELVRTHNLEETVNFAGFTSEPWRAGSSVLSVLNLLNNQLETLPEIR